MNFNFSFFILISFLFTHFCYAIGDAEEENESIYTTILSLSSSHGSRSDAEKSSEEELSLSSSQGALSVSNEQGNEESPLIAVLPKEVFQYALSFLDFSSFLKARGVSGFWRGNADALPGKREGTKRFNFLGVIHPELIPSLQKMGFNHSPVLCRIPTCLLPIDNFAHSYFKQVEDALRGGDPFLPSYAQQLIHVSGAIPQWREWNYGNDELKNEWILRFAEVRQSLDACALLSLTGVPVTDEFKGFLGRRAQELNDEEEAIVTHRSGQPGETIEVRLGIYSRDSSPLLRTLPLFLQYVKEPSSITDPALLGIFQAWVQLQQVDREQ